MPPDRPPELVADCANCSALCCVGPAFDASQGFAFDKPAHVPCVNLQKDYRCSVHERLRPLGFHSCAIFDCFGAGQRVTRLFAGKSWRSSPELASQMFDTYSRYRTLHELLVVLDLAITRASPDDAPLLGRLRADIERLCESEDVIRGTVHLDTLQKHVWAEVRRIVPGRPLVEPVSRS